jgi:hypothetical protein
MDEETIRNNNDVAASWGPIEDALRRYDGQTACRILQDLRRDDPRIWNGCHWKVNNWLVSWFRDNSVIDEKFHLDDFSSDDFVNFILKLYPFRIEATWNSDDLPHILHELRLLRDERDGLRRKAYAERAGG